jgi:hypothetical protein
MILEIRFINTVHARGSGIQPTALYVVALYADSRMLCGLRSGQSGF